MQFNPISLVIGLVFSPIAAAMAFLITYGEYSRHYTDKKMPSKLALEAAIMTFIIFGAISFLIGLVFGNI
jgi:H+/Cl- antiporter ClcA